MNQNIKQQTNPLITVFIPTYKRPLLLKKAIEIVLNQTWRNLQVIVCDNASKDETASVVSELTKKDPRIHYICHQKNLGMLANYQFALTILETEFFSFLSDDDLLLPCFCEAAMNGFFQFPDIAFFAGSTIILSPQKGVLRVPLDLWPREGKFEPCEGLPEMIGKFPIPTTVLFRKSAEIDFNNQSGWDCDFLIQLAGQFSFVISKQPCGIMVNHPSSFTSEQDYNTASIHRLIARIKGFSWMNEPLRSSTLKSMQRYLDQTTFFAILSNIVNNRLVKARTLSYEMITKQPFTKKALAGFIASSICSIFPFMRYPLILLKKVRKTFHEKHFIKQGFSTYKNLIDPTSYKK